MQRDIFRVADQSGSHVENCSDIMTTLFLSREEIVALTDKRKADAQIRWLRRHGYPYDVSGTGQPKVLRQVVIARLGGSVQNPEPKLRLIGNNK